MDVIELWSSDTKALVSPEGAWLTNLSDENGDILFPKRQLKAADGSTKTRGGSHVCLPNFGPAGDYDLPQHGFGRTETWEVLDQSQDSVQLRLSGAHAENYEGLVSTLTYTVRGHSLEMTLELYNDSDQVLRIAPAFHPYFALAADEEKIKIDDEPVHLDDLLEMQLAANYTRKKLTTARRVLHLESHQLNAWAQWTDRLGNYVCVEPTLDGYAFLQPTPSPEEQLHTQMTTEYTFAVTW